MAAAPRPEMICPANSTMTRVSVELAEPGVRKLISCPAMSRTVPPTSRRLRPNRSPSTPKVSSSRATGTRNASEIQVSWVAVVPRSCWKSPFRTAGMASATWATQTATHAAMRVPRVSRCGWAGAGLTVS